LVHLRSVRTLVVLLLLSTTASAHTTLTSPPPRTLDNKEGPCGAAGSTRGSTVKTFAPGATINVEWDETVDHPGHYRIAFDDDGDDVFVNPISPDDNFPFTLKEPIADKEGGHYRQRVTLPTAPCANCTLQLMQIMTTDVPYNSFYYQCADIAIAEGGDPGVPADDVDGGCSTDSGGGASGLAILVGLIWRARRVRGRRGR
jgi:hypothetical protein